MPDVLSADVNATSGRARLVWSADITKPSDWMRKDNKQTQFND